MVKNYIIIELVYVDIICMFCKYEKILKLLCYNDFIDKGRCEYDVLILSWLIVNFKILNCL